MSLGIIGRKCGMTRIFTENGQSIPVSVVHVDPNKVVQVKTQEVDGYNAVQVTAGHKKRSRVNTPLQGHYAKAKVEPGRLLKEHRVDAETATSLKAGQTIEVTMFDAGDKVDVTGISKGKGFAGVVKRHNFSTQDATHGNSLTYRAHGSTGQCQSPGRVFKNKKMAGQLGNAKTTVQSLEIVKVDAEKGLLLLKGGIPGAVGNDVLIKAAVKKQGKAQ